MKIYLISLFLFVASNASPYIEISIDEDLNTIPSKTEKFPKEVEKNIGKAPILTKVENSSPKVVEMDGTSPKGMISANMLEKSPLQNGKQDGAPSKVNIYSNKLEESKKLNGIIRDGIISGIEAENIRKNLRHLTKLPHIGGTDAEHDLINWISDQWESQGLDDVKHVTYDAMLSYPSQTEPNLVKLLQNNEVIWETSPKQVPLYAPEEASDKVPFNFNAYSQPGNIKVNEIVYVHYGREEDFIYLEEKKNIEMKGKLVIAKYGFVFRGNIVESAEKRGALGVILYSDPKDYAPYGKKFTYPDSVMMPDSAVASGTTYLYDGDPLTPKYPSVASAFRIPVEEAAIPKIPVQPISYSEALKILSVMEGEEVVDEWKGNLNVTYRYGPKIINGMQINLEVHTHNQRAPVKNVIGILKGKEEPDRYVIVGNHIDAWIFGGLDPSSGTATMMEMSRSIAQYHNETGWRPRRSILFCAWGSEEYGLIGSQEWVEQFGLKLSAKSVAYLNVDMALEGNYTLRAKAAPLLYDILWESAKKIRNPDEAEFEKGRETVYDTWKLRKADKDRPGYPIMQLLDSGSDYKGFQHNLGIPSLDITFDHEQDVIGEPLYHTLYETFALVDELYDRGFHFHRAIAQMWTDLAVTLASDVILPFSLNEYSLFLNNAEKQIKINHQQILDENNISLEYFEEALKNFETEARNFKNKINNVDFNDIMAIRQINDQLMAVERAFIDPAGLPGRPDYNNVISAPSIDDGYSGTAFSGLTDALIMLEKTTDEQEQKKLWRTFNEHLAAVTHYVNTAANVLTDDFW